MTLKNDLGLKYIIAILGLIMFYNIGYTNTAVIYCHSTVFTKVMLLYNTEWRYDHEMVVNYHGKKFYKIGPRWQHESQICFATFI